MRTLGGRDPRLQEGIRARRGGPSRAGSSSWCGAGAVPHVAARVAGNMLITLCSSVLSSEALRAIHRRQLVCAARPRQTQIPFFSPPFSRAGAGSEGLPRLPGGCSGDGDVLGPAKSQPRGEGRWLRGPSSPKSGPSPQAAQTATIFGLSL